MSVGTADRAALEYQDDERVGPAAAQRSNTPLVVSGALAAVLLGAAVGTGYWVYAAAAVAVLGAAVVSTRSRLGFLNLLVLAPFIESLAVGPVTIGRLLAGLSAVVLLVLLATGRLRIPRFPVVTWLPATGFVLLVVASGLWASDASGWLFAIGQAGLAVLFFAAFALLVRTPEQIAVLLRVYVCGSVFAALYGLAQAATTARAEGLQGDANIYAMYQVAALPAALALASRTSGVRKLLWLASMLPITASVLFSQSRGAYVAFIVTTLVVALLHERRRLVVPVALGAAAALGLATTLFGDRYSVEGVADDRASGRIDIWLVAWHAFLDHPWTGIGAGNFVGQSIDRLTTEPGVELVKSHLFTGQGIEVHNIYLEGLAERGVFGLVTLVVFLLATLYGLAVAATRYRTPVVTALVPMLVAFSVAAFFLSVPNSKLLWMLAGLAAALLAVRASGPDPAPSPDTQPRSLP